MKPCPLVFEPIFKQRIWGGRKLEGVLGLPLPDGELVGEAWVLADLPDDQSVVSDGPAKGKTLLQLVAEWGEGLLGHASAVEGRFPLLLKYLDANQHLSVQVHPDEEFAEQAGGKVRPKHEAWYVLEAEPDGCIYRGLVDGVDRAAFEEALKSGSAEKLLKRINVRPGHCYYLPAGTVHALGAGVVVAEVQIPSETTYRLFDWNRVDAASGKPRELHIEDGLGCSNFGSQEIEGEECSHVANVWTVVTRLVTCNSFIMERVRMTAGMDQEIPYDEMVTWMVLAGHGRITYEDGKESQPFKRGDTVVIPAALEGAKVVTEDECTWLEITIPQGKPRMLA